MVVESLINHKDSFILNNTRAKDDWCFNGKLFGLVSASKKSNWRFELNSIVRLRRGMDSVTMKVKDFEHWYQGFKVHTDVRTQIMRRV